MRGDRIEISSLPRCAEGGPSTYDLSIPVRTKALGPPVIVDRRGVRVLLTVTIHPTGAWGDMRGTAGNIYVYIKKKIRPIIGNALSAIATWVLPISRIDARWTSGVHRPRASSRLVSKSHLFKRRIMLTYASSLLAVTDFQGINVPGGNQNMRVG